MSELDQDLTSYWVAYREAAFKASVTIQANLCAVDLNIPVWEVPFGASIQHNSATHADPSTNKQAPAPSAEVAELQRRLMASGDADVIQLMTPDPAQLDPLDASGISRWLGAKGRNMDLAEEQIHVHAKWRHAFMPAGHISEVHHSRLRPHIHSFISYKCRL